ncbi:ThiF family adenylyltransferase [Methanocaldococcus infernus]
MDEVEELEKKLKPRGEVSIIGCGRLGVRVAFNLLEVHRGGAEKVYLFDSAKIEKNDIVHRRLGGKVGEYKVDLVKRFFGERAEVYRTNINKDNLHLIKGDVVIICIAGGDTIPITREIVNYCHERGIKTIGSNGVFGIEEKVYIDDSQYTKGPAKLLGVKNHTVVGTRKFIKDGEPITPYTLDEIAKKMVILCLKYLYYG